jgi:hypothetical protein
LRLYSAEAALAFPDRKLLPQRNGPSSGGELGPLYGDYADGAGVSALGTTPEDAFRSIPSLRVLISRGLIWQLRKPDGLKGGTGLRPLRFHPMRIPDERLNLVMLAVVALFTAAIATGAAFMQRPAAAEKPVYLADRTPVRVVGPTFVPNTNPRER